MLTSSLCFHQTINEATHLLNNSSSTSSIDFIFTSQLTLVTESSVHSSLHTNCYHQTTYSDFKLNVFIHLPMRESYGPTN